MFELSEDILVPNFWALYSLLKESSHFIRVLIESSWSKAKYQTTLRFLLIHLDGFSVLRDNKLIIPDSPFKLEVWSKNAFKYQLFI